MTWTFALTSRIWSWVSREGTKAAGPPSMLENLPSQKASQCSRLARQDLTDGLVGAGVARRQREVLPRHPGELGRRRVPRVVWVGKRHPAEPGLVVAERGEPVHGQVGHPVGVVPLARDRVVLRLGRAGVATRLGLEQPGEAVQVLRVVFLQPAAVVRDGMVPPGGGVHGLLRALEAPPGSVVAPGDPGVLLPPELRVEAGLEVRLAQERGPVARGVVQVLGDRGGVDRQGDAVGHHAVRAHVLARQHGRARRHAHRVLVVGAPVVDPLGGQAVDHRGAGHRAAVAAQAVVALLVGRDEEDVPAAGSGGRVRLRHLRPPCRPGVPACS